MTDTLLEARIAEAVRRSGVAATTSAHSCARHMAHLIAANWQPEPDAETLACREAMIMSGSRPEDVNAGAWDHNPYSDGFRHAYRAGIAAGRAEVPEPEHQPVSWKTIMHGPEPEVDPDLIIARETYEAWARGTGSGMDRTLAAIKAFRAAHGLPDKGAFVKLPEGARAIVATVTEGWAKAAWSVRPYDALADAIITALGGKS